MKLCLSDAIKTHLSGQYNLNSLRKIAMKEGMKSLRLSGAQKIAAGVTTLEEVLR